MGLQSTFLAYGLESPRGLNEVFVLQEKMKSKNKLALRLLGITKESVMRVDEKTKEVVQEWPLTTVKRWAASPKSFTLVRLTHMLLESVHRITSTPMN